MILKFMYVICFDSRRLRNLKSFVKPKKITKTFPLLSLNIASIEVRVIDGTG